MATELQILWKGFLEKTIGFLVLGKSFGTQGKTLEKAESFNTQKRKEVKPFFLISLHIFLLRKQ